MKKNYINNKSGILSWIFTVDHKRIGIMYLAFILFSFLIGGLLALALRIELMSPEKILFTAREYNQVFTLHGAVMVFLFIVPSIPASLGNFFLPIMLGAKDVAFPKLNLASCCWCYFLFCFNITWKCRYGMDFLYSLLFNYWYISNLDDNGCIYLRVFFYFNWYKFYCYYS